MSDDHAGYLADDLIGPAETPLILSTDLSQIRCTDDACLCRGAERIIPLPRTWNLGQLASAVETHRATYDPCL